MSPRSGIEGLLFLLDVFELSDAPGNESDLTAEHHKVFLVGLAYILQITFVLPL